MNALGTMLLFPIIGESFEENVAPERKDIFMHSYLVSYKCLYSLHAALTILECKQDTVDLTKLSSGVSFDSPEFDFYLRPFHPFDKTGIVSLDDDEDEEEEKEEGGIKQDNSLHGAVGFCVHLLQATGINQTIPGVSPRAYLFDSPPPSLRSKDIPKPEFLNVFGNSMGPFGFFHASLFHFREGCDEPDRCMVCTMFRSTLRTLSNAFISSRFRDILNFYFKFEKQLEEFQPVDFLYSNHANFMLDFCKQMNAERKILLKLNARYRDIIVGIKTSSHEANDSIREIVKSNDEFQVNIHKKMVFFEDARVNFCKMLGTISNKGKSLGDLIKKQEKTMELVKSVEAENNALKNEIKLLEDEFILPPPPPIKNKRKRRGNKNKKTAVVPPSSPVPLPTTSFSRSPPTSQELEKIISDLQQQNRDFALRHSRDMKEIEDMKSQLIETEKEVEELNYQNKEFQILLYMFM